tara:strand:- start:67 stop:366 length:300 start_codon:yes stop_codon:yes gene_type:complete
MKFPCKKCNNETEFLHLKNKDSKLFELCDDCFDIEVKLANSQYVLIDRKNNYEKIFYIVVISFVLLGASYFCFTDGFSGNCDPAVDENCFNYGDLIESD